MVIYMTDIKTIADTMIQQFGGNRAFQMIGGYATYGVNKGNNENSVIYNGSEGDVYVDIRFKAKAAKVKGKSPNGFRIVYHADVDLYSVVLFRIHGTTVTSLKESSFIFADMLKDVFENNTKLYLSL